MDKIHFRITLSEMSFANILLLLGHERSYSERLVRIRINYDDETLLKYNSTRRITSSGFID